MRSKFEAARELLPRFVLASCRYAMLGFVMLLLALDAGTAQAQSSGQGYAPLIVSRPVVDAVDEIRAEAYFDEGSGARSSLWSQAGIAHA